MFRENIKDEVGNSFTAVEGAEVAKMLKSNSELVSIANNFMKVMKPSFLKNSVCQIKTYFCYHGWSVLVLP